MRDTMKSELERHFGNLVTIDGYGIATYLDPRYKAKFFSNNNELNQKLHK